MSSSRTATLVVLAALTWAPLATFQQEIISAGGGGTLGVPDSVSQAYLSHPNATGTTNFTLQTTTVDPIQRLGFTMQLNITADIPLDNVTTASTGENEAGLFEIASILSLNGPVEGIAPNAPTATICYSVWSGLAANITEAAINQPGTGTGAAIGCGGILSDDCISDLLGAADDFQWDCSGSPQIPETCSGQMAASYSGISSRLTYNSSNPAFYTAESAPYQEKGNQTAWTEAAINIFPVLMTFGSNISVDSGETVSPDGWQIQTQLNCMKADAFSEGTTDPKDAATSGTSSGSTPTGTASSSTSTPSNGVAKSYQVSMTGPLALIAMVFAFLA